MNRDKKEIKPPAIGGVWKPKVFVSKIRRLRIVDSDNPPRHDSKGEAIWGTTIVFSDGVYIPKNRKEERLLLTHPAYNKSYWVQDEVPQYAQNEQVLGTVTLSKPENVLTADEIK